MPLKRLGFYLLVAAVSVPLWTALAATPTELLSNGSFESGTAGWQTFGGQLSSATQPAYSGSFAAAYASADFKAKWFYQDVPVSPGGMYTFSGWAVKNSSRIAEVKLRISWYAESVGYGTQASGPEISSVTSTVISSDSPAWRQLTTGPAEAPSRALVARLKVILMPASGDSATAFFDGLSFVGSGPSLPPTPASPPSGGASGPGQEAGDPPDPPPVPSPQATPAATPTASPTYPPTPVATVVPMPSPIPTPTMIPTRTPTPTLRPTRTPTLRPTSTPRPTRTPTARPSATPAPTPGVSPASGATPAFPQSGAVASIPSPASAVRSGVSSAISSPVASPQAGASPLPRVTPSFTPVATTAPPVEDKMEAVEAGSTDPGGATHEAPPLFSGDGSVAPRPSPSAQPASTGGSQFTLPSPAARPAAPARPVVVPTPGPGAVKLVVAPPSFLESPDGEEDGHEANSVEDPARGNWPVETPQSEASSPAVQVIVAISSLGAASVALSLWLRKWI